MYAVRYRAGLSGDGVRRRRPAPWPNRARRSGTTGRTGCERSRCGTPEGHSSPRLGDRTAFGAPLGFVVFHLVCGEPRLAADWVEKSIEQRYPGILFFVNLPFGKVLRASPRWPALARRMNLPADFKGPV